MNSDMERINLIFNNKTYRKYLKEIEKWEESRIYCLHDVNHFFDVARIALIISKEENITVSSELIYAAALLHDIGRSLQYENGTPHEEASAKISDDILTDAGFNDNEKSLIIEAISQHGNEKIKWDKDLNGLIYRADKLSRKCFYCRATDTCKKREDKRNMSLVI